MRLRAPDRCRPRPPAASWKGAKSAIRPPPASRPWRRASPSFRRLTHRLAQSALRKKCVEARKKLAQKVRTLNGA